MKKYWRNCEKEFEIKEEDIVYLGDSYIYHCPICGTEIMGRNLHIHHFGIEEM